MSTFRRNITNNLFERFGSKFCEEAQKSPISHQLAAGVIKDKKLVGKVCCNTLSNNDSCGSLHAEANAITTYFGKNLSFDKYRKMWYLKWGFKQCKET
jgi:hypothetical protein